MIRLHRTISVASFDVVATVATGRDRPEWLAVARLAADLGPIDGAAIVRELGLPSPVGGRVLDRCVAIGLLAREGIRGPAALSELGRKALESGEVLVPEEGTWRIHTCDDPLIDDPILHVARLPESRAQPDRQQSKGEAKPAQAIPQQTPARLMGSRGRMWKSIAKQGPRFEVREVGQRGLSGPDHRLKLEVVWEPGEVADLRTSGTWAQAEPGKDAKVEISIEGSLGLPSVFATRRYDDLWSYLVSLGADVDREEVQVAMRRTNRRVAPRRFGDLTGGQRRAMRSDLEVPSFWLDAIGQFEPSRLTDVELVPLTDEDAQRWAEWRLWNQLDDYVTRARLDQLADEAIQPFRGYRVVIPSPEHWLDEAQKNPGDPKSRFIFAPADLGLWRQS